ncbi:hypothetical protein ACQEVY_20635 [Streptomyces sp. CA-288835]|uniref:hypothetical protein n=1 Tax=Streptomyces sp. CA-288835 TaxID=3240069 RepID=UPI003D8F6958
MMPPTTVTHPTAVRRSDGGDVSTAVTYPHGGDVPTTVMLRTAVMGSDDGDVFQRR